MNFFEISEVCHVIEILSQFESEQSQNFMYMPSRDTISFDDFLIHLKVPPSPVYEQFLDGLGPRFKVTIAEILVKQSPNCELMISLHQRLPCNHDIIFIS